MCAGLMPGKMADASLVQLATTAGIATDKMLTLRAAGETWKEPEQPIDLSKLTVEQLLTLDGWLPEGSGGQRGAGQADVGEPRPAAGG